MKISYKKLWKLLIDKNINKSHLSKAANISTGTMAKMGKDLPVSLTVLYRICALLNCDIGDIVTFK